MWWSCSKLSLLLSGHPPNPKCRWDTYRILNTGIGWWHGADSAPSGWQPGHYRDQLCHIGIHRPPDAGGASTVNPRCPVGWWVSIHWYSTCWAAQQHNIRPHKQCGSRVARAHCSADGSYCNRGNSWRSADHEQPTTRESGSGRWQQTTAGDGERRQRQPRALRVNHHHHVFVQLFPASRDHWWHWCSDPSNCSVCRRVWPLLLRELQLPPPLAANPGQSGFVMCMFVRHVWFMTVVPNLNQRDYKIIESIRKENICSTKLCLFFLILL